MNYPAHAARVLRPRHGAGPVALDLFAGCGGLSLGFEAAGFVVAGYEHNADACATHRRNLIGSSCHRTLTSRSVLPPCDIIVGGPPCQPFSVNGTQHGQTDQRNGLEIFVSAVRRLRPQLWVMENVRGLLGRSRPYFEDIARRLRDLRYIVDARVLNAHQFGVPQNRERLIVVGWRDGRFHWPRRSASGPTCRDALGELAEEIPEDAKFLTPGMEAYIARYEAASGCATPRDLHLDAAARTLTCRNLAGATGDMHRIRLADGRRRRLTIREAARLQSFPDWFEFEGSCASALTQIGNAVPPLLALRLARACRQHLEQ